MSSNHLHRVDPVSIAFPLAITANYEIESVSPLVIQNDDNVAVTFHSSKPNVSDWIGAYSPAGVNISLVSPIKFGMCDYGSADGYGTITFNLTNLREEVTFHYFTGGLISPILVGSSLQKVTFSDVNEPLRNRVVPTGDPNTFTLLWSSSSSEQPLLKWGLHSGNYTYSVLASSSRIEKSSLCGGVASTIGWRDLGLIHRANITGLLDNQLSSKRLYYTFGDNKTDNFSPEKVFQVPPRAGKQPFDHLAEEYVTSALAVLKTDANENKDTITTAVAEAITDTSTTASIPNRPTQIVLMADLGVGAADSTSDTKVFSEACIPALNTTNSIGHRVQQGEVDAVLLSGDLSYANGYLANWEFFLDSISPIAGGSLFLSTVGNHESDWLGSTSLYQGRDSGGECGLSSDLLPMPSPASRLQPWWSYDVGLIHLVGMSTEHDFSPDSPQFRWLERDLGNVNRSITPWVVFTGHRPAYVDSQSCCGWGVPEQSCGSAPCFANSDIAVMQQLQEYIDPLLWRYQVNLAFAGHFHNVQRQSAVYRNKVVQRSIAEVDELGNVIHFQRNPPATVHMVIGSAGNGPSYSNRQYAWSEASWDNLFGYAIVTAVNATYLQWEFINSATDEVVDRVVLTQDFSRWKLPTTDDSGYDYNPHAQVLVAIIGTVIVVLSLLGAYMHHRHTKRALQLINGAHQLLDQQSTHSTGNATTGASADSGVGILSLLALSSTRTRSNSNNPMALLRSGEKGGSPLQYSPTDNTNAEDSDGVV